MLVMVVFFITFRWIHLSTPLIRLFLLVLILLLMPTLNFLPVWFALSLLRFRLPSRLPMTIQRINIIGSREGSRNRSRLKATLNFLPVWFALSLLRFRLPSRLPMMFILWMVAMMVVIIPSRTVRLLTSFPVRRAIMFMLVSWFGLTLPLLNAADWFR